MKLELDEIGVIHQDSEGRFSLNDFHRASGGDPNKQPAFWLRYDEAQALINELKSADSQINPVNVQRGRAGGTYAVKELIYAYAMWISPIFQLRVIRAFEAVRTGNYQLATSLATGKVAAPVDDYQVTVNKHKALAEIAVEFGVPKETCGAIMLKSLGRELGMVEIAETMRKALPGVADAAVYNMTMLGEELGVSKILVGRVLREEGLIEDVWNGGERQVVLTERGTKYGEMKPYQGDNGRTGYQALFKKSVLDVINKMECPL